MRIHTEIFGLGLVFLVAACSTTPPARKNAASTGFSNPPGPTKELALSQSVPNSKPSSHPEVYPKPTDNPFLYLPAYPDPGYIPSSQTPSPTSSPTPTTLPERIEIRFEELGLLWHECELPRPQNQTKEDCLGVTMNARMDGDESPFGETFTPQGGISPAKRLRIGNDVYEAVHVPYQGKGFTGPDGLAEFRLYKNSRLLITKRTHMVGYENASLLNINGKYTWEFAEYMIETIIYDGVDLRQELGFEAVYRPYIIEGRMIFVARNHGKMFVVVDGVQIGHAYDEILNGYCCETPKIMRAPGQYWFIGKKDGRTFQVVITASD